MRFTFLSNMLHHHQQPFCEAMHAILGDQFRFITTMPLTEELKGVGYSEQETLPSYVVPMYMGQDRELEAQALFLESDMVLYGAECPAFVAKRKKSGRPILFYSERFFKEGFRKVLRPRPFQGLIRRHTLWRWHSNIHLLCAGAYVAEDVQRIFAYPQRYKWGYFTEVPQVNTESLHSSRSELPVLLWVGRFLDWKHPEMAIRAAERLKEKGLSFRLRMVGDGALRPDMIALVKQLELEDCVELPGAMGNALVRQEMAKAHIHLFTSSSMEGWGAVLNESMTAGCVPVVSHMVGAAPFLVKHGHNGSVFASQDQEDLDAELGKLVGDLSRCREMGTAAALTMQDWSPEMAARRVLELSEQILAGQVLVLPDSGPCSRADVLTGAQFLEAR